jgi:hypothetical protein
LTDANCGAKQTCANIDDVTHVGSCKNLTPAKDCDTFCMKAQACAAPDADRCQEECTGLSVDCVTCVNKSTCGQGCDDVCML